MTVSLDLSVLLVVLAPIIGAILVLVADLVAPRQQRAHYAIAFISLLLGVYGTLATLAADPGNTAKTLCLDAVNCLYEVNAVSATLQLAALLGAMAVLALGWPLERPQQADRTSTQIVLLLTATSGAVGVAGARDLASWLVLLELATVPVVVLVAIPGTRRALDGAMQLLTTSLVSFGLLVLGAALWYAATGSALLRPNAVLAVDTSAQRALLTLSVVLILSGIGFKLSLAPFHAWTPATYAGAPLPIATFLAAVSKVAALAAVVVVMQALAALGGSALATIAVLAILSMTIGNVVALRQNDVVRLLAWSTVGQAGWVIMPLVSISPSGVKAASGYLLGYVVATIVAFTVVTIVARGAQSQRGRAPYQLDAYRGLLRARPGLGGALALALTSLAGLPPGLLGLVTKVLALRPVLAEGWWVLAVLAAVNVVIGVAVYVRWFRVLLEPLPAPALPSSVRTHPSHAIALATSATLLLVLSLAPQSMLGLFG
ncbi:MAG TPA: proton-conducting transporter membrane subunit [Candidatus Lustribacter sp.]|nr:proton-conducting transporter membrane subunit [Candidatus Lustribacter sp.]